MLDSLTFWLPKFNLAYLDGGTGSMALQVALAGFLSAGYVIKTRWQGLKAYFSRKSKSQD